MIAMRVKENLQTLKDTDIYSVVMFALYKIMDVPEYAQTSQLQYVLDKKNLLNLCEYFGGRTIKIPTIDEIETLVYSLVLYQFVNIDKMSLDDAVKLLNCENTSKVRYQYRKMCKVLDKYDV